MHSALPMLLFLGFLTGATLLILICGVQSREEERAERREDPFADLDLYAIPRFFGRPGEALPERPVAVVLDEPLVHRVEDFLREELALAEVFADEPSVEGLHRQPAAKEQEPSIFERLESYLVREQEAVEGFLSRPSIESLYDRFQGVPVRA